MLLELECLLTNLGDLTSFLHFPQKSSPTILNIDFSSLHEKYFDVVIFHKKTLEDNFLSVTDFFQMKN